ncbi:hypothetical protein LCGC14_2335480 [marine sediment metagenome]|uniref:Uncharacterized protein n=1 Tax=marine sediment metagenome TaxID=412755 RepID=A0A0F9CDJ0_9ZZZZ
MDKKRIARTDFDKYRDSLAVRGYASYKHYLASEAWRAFNVWYRSTKQLPQACLVCGTVPFLLHHISYKRAGQELLDDVRPLCREHHEQLHRWLANHGGRIGDFDCLLTECFGISAKEAKQKSQRFLRLGCNNKPRAVRKFLCKRCGDRMRRLHKGERICRLCRESAARAPSAA